MTGLLPVIAAFQGAFWVDQDVGDVLHVPHLGVAAPNFEAPVDANADNVYQVTVMVSDGGGFADTQAIAVPYAGSFVELGAAFLPLPKLISFGASLLICIILGLYMAKSDTGKAIR